MHRDPLPHDCRYLAGARVPQQDAPRAMVNKIMSQIGNALKKNRFTKDVAVPAAYDGDPLSKYVARCGTWSRR